MVILEGVLHDKKGKIRTVGYKVGDKGQVVISKSIRTSLGIAPGWTAIQRLVGDHVEMRFVPPEHNRSLKGSLSSYVKSPLSADELRDAKENVWREAATDKWSEDSTAR